MLHFIIQKDQTALIYAIHGKHLIVAEKLILPGSDVTIKDKVYQLYMIHVIVYT